MYMHCTYSKLRETYLFLLTSEIERLIFCVDCFLKHPCIRFCLFIFIIFRTRDVSRTMVRRVWRFLLPADHGIGGLICPCLVAWSPWFIFLLYTYDYLYFILFSFQISVVIWREIRLKMICTIERCGLLCTQKVHV